MTHWDAAIRSFLRCVLVMLNSLDVEVLLTLWVLWRQNFSLTTQISKIFLTHRTVRSPVCWVAALSYIQEIYSTWTEPGFQRFTFWWKRSQYVPNHFLSKEVISTASYMPNFLHVKMTTSPVFPIDIFPFIPTMYLAPYPPPGAILMKAVHKS